MDSLLVNGLFLAAAFLFFYWLNRGSKLDKIPIKILAFAGTAFVIGISLLWVNVSHTYPEADQKAVSWVAWLMSQNNFLFFEHGKYMQIYPNQLGLAAILEGLYRLAGEENQKLFMYITALNHFLPNLEYSAAGYNLFLLFTCFVAFMTAYFYPRVA